MQPQPKAPASRPAIESAVVIQIDKSKLEIEVKEDDNCVSEKAQGDLNAMPDEKRDETEVAEYVLVDKVDSEAADRDALEQIVANAADPGSKEVSVNSGRKRGRPKKDLSEKA